MSGTESDKPVYDRGHFAASANRQRSRGRTAVGFTRESFVSLIDNRSDDRLWRVLRLPLDMIKTVQALKNQMPGLGRRAPPK